MGTALSNDHRCIVKLLLDAARPQIFKTSSSIWAAESSRCCRFKPILSPRLSANFDRDQYRMFILTQRIAVSSSRFLTSVG